MPVHPECGVRIYYDAAGDATLLAYRKLHLQYLVLCYRRGEAGHTLASFADILDTLPVESVALAGVRLDLLPTLDETIDGWRDEVLRTLRRRVTSGTQTER